MIEKNTIVSLIQYNLKKKSAKLAATKAFTKRIAYQDSESLILFNIHCLTFSFSMKLSSLHVTNLIL